MIANLLSRPIYLLVTAALFAGIGAGGAGGQILPPAGDAEDAEAPVIRLYTGQSRLIHSPWPVVRISVDQPEVADIQMLAPDRIQVVGIGLGSAELTMWGEDDVMAQVYVVVEADVRGLQAQLARMFPRSDLQMHQVQGVLIVSGTLAGTEESAQLQRFLEALRIDALDMTQVAGVQQVQLQVRVAEVSRVALQMLNANWFYNEGNWFLGNQLGSSAGPFTPMNVGIPEGHVMNGSIPFTVGEGGISVPAGATLFAGFPGRDLEFFIQALAENQYLRLLAEPNLVALSGEEASFLAGGEFPIPVAQGTGVTATISIEFKEFGVRLAFRPTVLGDGRIRLLVAPEVSELSDVGAVEIQGFRIPGLITRRAETTIEMNSGQTFGMAGLISRSTTARVSRVPGLGSLPILGALFRSTRYARSETELVVLVTASLVEPLSVGPVPLPGVQHRPPNPWEFYALGRIAAEAPAPLGPAHAEHLQELGLHRLRGPGTWAKYDARSR